MRVVYMLSRKEVKAVLSVVLLPENNNNNNNIDVS